MRTVPALSAFLAIMSSAAAQSADSVTVNPQGAQTLYDPGTGQERVVPPLLQPWQNEHRPVRLRPPGKHRHSETTSASAPEPPVASAGETAPPPPRRIKRTATAAPPPAPPQKSAPISGFSDFTDLISPQQSQPSPPPSPPPAKKAAALAPSPKKPAVQPRPAPMPEPPRAAPPVEKPAPVEKPVQKASIEPPKPAKNRVTGTPRDSIAFAPNASDPSTSAVSAVRNLATSLNAALGDSTARVQLMAYAGQRGEKSSDTRRLSLKRALVIRQLLIDDGIPSERIDVFALGGTEDSGPLDRVDVFVKS